MTNVLRFVALLLLGTLAIFGYLWIDTYWDHHQASRELRVIALRGGVTFEEPVEVSFHRKVDREPPVYDYAAEVWQGAVSALPKGKGLQGFRPGEEQYESQKDYVEGYLCLKEPPKIYHRKWTSDDGNLEILVAKTAEGYAYRFWLNR